MSLTRAIAGARIIETAQNYSVADNFSDRPLAVPELPYGPAFYDDEHFWRDILFNPQAAWNTEVHLYEVILSEWVARVPGLFWTPEARSLRQFDESEIEEREPHHVTLQPTAKSRVVTGGVGTLRLAPDAQGTRLATLTTTANVSCGVPVLISDDYWRRNRLHEGCVIDPGAPAHWRAMAREWSSLFPSVRGIPRGYLVLDEDTRPATHGPYGVQIHPFSIMEYEADNHELFDFVYATADSTDRRFRQGIERFFKDYRRGHGRNGRYLLAADLVQPLWDALYESPDQLRRSHPAGQSHLALLEARVRRSMLGDHILDELLERLTSLGDVEHLKRISLDLSIPYTLWFANGTMAQASADFLARVPEEKLPGLIDALAHEDFLRSGRDHVLG